MCSRSLTVVRAAFVFASLARACRSLETTASPVLPKCCPDGMMGFPKNCSNSEEPLLHPFKPWLDYTTRVAPIQCDQYMFMESWEYKVDAAGNLELTDDPPTVEPPENYCFDVHIQQDPEYESDSPGAPAIGAFLCFLEEAPTIVPTSYPIGMIFSVPFLAATAVTYAVIRKLWNLHGRCLVAQCTSLSLAYIFLIVIQLFTEDIPFKICKLLGE